MTKSRQIINAIIMLFLGSLVTMGSYAFFTWSSSVNKQVSFNTAKELQEYIVYDEGESQFSGEFKVSSTYQQGIHSTIGISKTSEAANVNLVAAINMDVNQIGANMKKSTALKWVVTEGTTTNIGNVLARGNFIGVNANDTVTLVPSLPVSATEQKYTIWIWLDASEYPSDALSGETLDTVVWTQIDQVEGVTGVYEITKIDSNYQVINATVINNENKITHYAITTSNTEPTTWNEIPTNEQANVYNLTEAVSETGTHYVWFKDEDGNTISRTVNVDSVDSTGTVCVFDTWSQQVIANNETSSIDLTCIDTESVITNSNLSISSFTKSNNKINITNIVKSVVTNGYKYTITVTGTINDGASTITLPAGSVKNAIHLGNDAVTSPSVGVANLYTVSYEANKFSTSPTTTNGLTIGYNQITSILTLNGTQDTTSNMSIALMQLGDQVFTENDEYKIKLTYVGGTVSTSDDAYMRVGVYTEELAAVTTSNNVTIEYPTSGSETLTLSINSAGESEGSVLGVGLYEAAENVVTFNNYQVKVEIIKVEEIEIAYGDNYILPSQEPTRENHEFDGWYTQASGGEEITSSIFMSTSSDHTIYAHWILVDEISAPTISFESNVVTNGLVAQFDGRNNTGNGYSADSEIWKDLSDNNNDGNINGAAWEGYSMIFDGASSFVELGAHNYSYYTVETVFEINSVLQEGKTSIFGNWESGGIGIEIVDGSIRLTANVDGTYQYSIMPTLAVTNRIYHVAGTYDGANLKLYVDGMLVANTSVSGTITTTTNDTVFVLGCNPGGSTCQNQYLDGTIYSARIYNRALTDSELAQNYNMDRFSLSEDAEGTPSITISGSTSSADIITGYEYSLDNGTTWNSYNSANKPRLIANGIYEITARAYDSYNIFGNETVEEIIVTNPSPTISFESNVVTNGLVAQFDGRNNTGGGYKDNITIWKDLSGNNNGTINGATWDENSLSFDGDDDYVSIGVINSSYITMEATFSIDEEISNRHNIIHGSNAVIFIGETSKNGNIYGSVKIGTTWNEISTNIHAVVNRVYHVALTYDGSIARVYIDGVLVSSLELNSALASSDYLTVLGCNPTTSGCNSDNVTYHAHLNGNIYSARVYNRALTEAEVRQNYKMDKMSVGGGYVSGNPNFTLNSSNAINNVINPFKYDINETGNWNTYNSANKPTLVSDGENLILARAYSGTTMVGNESEVSVSLDNTPPTGVLAVDVGDTITATITVSDTLSGVRDWYGFKVSTSNVCDETISGFVESDVNSYTFAITQAGTYYVCVRYEDEAGNYGYDIEKTPVTYFPYTGGYQTFVANEAGYYFVETWGAKGGSGGNGGYVSGYTYLEQGDELYVYVGGSGGANTSTQSNPGGYNGGGPGGNNSGAKSYGGGGATDVRYFGNYEPTSSDLTWNSTLGLNSRIMVAGGGGGTFKHNSNTYTNLVGGAGGTLVAGNGSSSFSNDSTTAAAVTSGGTQIAGGTSNYGSARNGSFGFAPQSATTSFGGGGAGGYYGGATGYGKGGSGGSSFMSGYAGVNAITASDDRTHTNNTLHYSDKYFIDGTMTSATNNGAGKAKITKVSEPERINNDLSNVRYIRDCINGNSANVYNHWVEIQAIQDGVNVAKDIPAYLIGTSVEDTSHPLSRITDGIITAGNWAGGSPATGYQCVELDLDYYDQMNATYFLDEIAVWHYYADGRTYYDNVTYVSSDGVYYVPVIRNNSAESSTGKRISAWDPSLSDNEPVILSNLDGYTVYTASQDGYYKVEAWGAEGGTSSSSYPAGKGGYTSGYVHLTAGDNLYLYIGLKGNATANVTNLGGYNGGGNSGNNSGQNSFGGGGATDIRYFGSTTPSTSDLTWNSTLGLNSRIMVAGGGGGTVNKAGNDGGYGGTLVAGNASGTHVTSWTYNGTSYSNATPLFKGATQTTGGTSNYSNDRNGGFGVPAFTGSNYSSGWGGGAGGGYYTGSNGFGNGGSGGSSFMSGYAGVNAINSSRTHTNNTLHYSNKYFINGKMQANVNSGVGRVNITYYGTSEPERINEDLEGVRYIRDCIDGSNTGTGNAWNEIQAIVGGVNVAYGKSITSTGTIATGDYTFNAVTDGDIINLSSNAYINETGLQCVVVDLESTYDLDEIAVWHYWHDGNYGNPNRIYSDNITSVSSDGNEWIPVIGHPEAESANGKRINAWEIDPLAKDVEIPVASISTTANLRATSQTANIACTDDINVASYYWGTTAPTSTSTYTSITKTKNFSTTKSVTAAGTYYLSCRDEAGKTSDYVTKVYNSYKVNTMLLKVGGASATRTTDNYAQASTNTYIAPNGTTLVWSEIYTNSIPTGSRIGRYVGISSGAASTTSATLLTENSVLNANSTYSLWFTRNVISIFYRPNGGTLRATTTSADGNTTYTWSLDADNNILRSTNGSEATNYVSHLQYGATTMDLPNYNYANGLYITRTGYAGSSGAEWKCLSGCKTSGQTFSQAASTAVTPTNVCSSIATADCTVYVGVNWVADTTAPTIALSVSSGTTYAKSRSGTVTISDNMGLAAGTYTIKYKWSTSSVACSAMTSTKSITVSTGAKSATTTITISSGTGKGKLYICNSAAIKDFAGNSLAANTNKSANMYLDNTVPWCNLYYSKMSSGVCAWGNHANDEHSGLTYYGLSSSYSGSNQESGYVSGSGTITYYVKDKAGNKASCSIRYSGCS